MTRVEQQLLEAGIALPEVPAPVAAYVSARRAGSFVFTAGQIPREQEAIMFPGRVGGEVTQDEARKAARVAALQAIAALGSIADLDHIRITKVTVFVASVSDFSNQPFVADGASELLVQAFGEDGRHARSAVGVANLPLNACVEVEVIAEVLG